MTLQTRWTASCSEPTPDSDPDLPIIGSKAASRCFPQPRVLLGCWQRGQQQRAPCQLRVAASGRRRLLPRAGGLSGLLKIFSLLIGATAGAGPCPAPQPTPATWEFAAGRLRPRAARLIKVNAPVPDRAVRSPGSGSAMRGLAVRRRWDNANCRRGSVRAFAITTLIVEISVEVQQSILGIDLERSYILGFPRPPHAR